jgi:hypothetical protein
MNLPRILVISVAWGLLSAEGCSRHATEHETERHVGPKVNVPDFMAHASNYKGKTITLVLRIDEPIDRSSGQSLRTIAGRDVRFSTKGGLKGTPTELTIHVADVPNLPEVGRGDEVRVTFLCSRGNLREGNEAKMIELP